MAGRFQGGQHPRFFCMCLLKTCFCWDSTAFLQSEASKVLYCPKKTNAFKEKLANWLYCPKKTQAYIFTGLGALNGLEVLFFASGFLVTEHCQQGNQRFQASNCKHAVLSKKRQKRISSETSGHKMVLKFQRFFAQYNIFLHVLGMCTIHATGRGWSRLGSGGERCARMVAAEVWQRLGGGCGAGGGARRGGEGDEADINLTTLT